MKKLIFIFLSIIEFSTVKSQIINIPDSIFKQKLLTLEIDTNNDGNIDESEALDVTHLNLEMDDFNNDEKEIKSIEGIQYFKNLQELNLNNNPIDSINLFENNKLEYLYCNGNNFSFFLISNKNILKHLSLIFNSLETLDIPVMDSLEYLYLSGNRLSNIPIDNMPRLKYLTISDNKLSQDSTRIFNLHNNQSLEELDLKRTNFSQINISNTSIRELAFSGEDIETISLENNDSLNSLWIAGTKLTSINFSLMPQLKSLMLSDTKLSSINFNTIPQLKSLNLINNENIETIDLSMLRNLWSVNCSGDISSIKFPSNLINHFNCSNNKLTTLDLRNTQINNLYCNNNLIDSLNVYSTSNLKNLQCKNNRISQLILNNDKLKSIDCSYNNITEIDLSKVPNLLGLVAMSCKLQQLDLSMLNNLSSVSVSNNNIHKISLPSSMVELLCSNNLLESLNLDNTKIEWLFCNNNNIDSLNTTKNSILTRLDCSHNNMSKLIMNNDRLYNLNCSNNNFTELDFTHIENLYSAKVLNVPLLKKICVWSIPYAPAEILVDRDDILIIDCLSGLTNKNYYPKISVYPNPISDVLHIKNDNQKNLFVSLYNSNGKRILEKSFNHRHIQIDLKSQTKGIFILKIIGDNYIQSFKLLKE